MNTVTDTIFASDTFSNITVWDLKCGTSLMNYKSGIINYRCLEVLQNDYVLGVEKGPLIYAWPLNSQEKIQEIRMVCPGLINCFAVSLDGLYIAVSIENKLLIWQISTGKLLSTVSGHYQSITVIRWTRDSSDIVTGGEDGLICVWKLSHLISSNYMYMGIKSSDSTKSQTEARYTFSDHSIKITDLFVGRGGQRTRLFTASVDKTCKVYDLATGNQLLSIVFDVRPTCIVVDVPEINVFIGTTEGTIKTFSLLDPPRSLNQHFDDCGVDCTFKGHTKSVTCLSMSTDECMLISGSADETIKVWYIHNRQCVRTIRMRGSITNLVIKTLSKQFNSYQFQPKSILKSFQKRYDENPIETIDIFCPVDNYSSCSSDEDNSENEVAVLSKKLEEMKQINRELFYFAKEQILNNNIMNAHKSNKVKNK